MTTTLHGLAVRELKRVVRVPVTFSIDHGEKLIEPHLPTKLITIALTALLKEWNSVYLREGLKALNVILSKGSIILWSFLLHKFLSTGIFEDNVNVAFMNKVIKSLITICIMLALCTLNLKKVNCLREQFLSSQDVNF